MEEIMNRQWYEKRRDERREAARSVGISYKDYMDGATIPAGWRLDPEIDYFLPPNMIS